MYIEYTEAAAAEINKLLDGRKGFLKLFFDSEGCGCALAGVPVIWIESESSNKDLTAEGHPFETKFEQKHEVFFEARMKVDYSKDKQAFKLSNSSQIYNAMMSVIDMRNHNNY